MNTTATPHPHQGIHFGDHARALWSLEPGHYLNHGTVGAPPTVVLDARKAWLDRIERHPARVMFQELRPALRAATDAIAPFLGAESDDLVFVDNTTSGIQSILRSFPFEAGDALLCGVIGYGGVTKGLEYVARTRQLRLDTFEVALPVSAPDAVIDAFERALTPQTRIAVVDHINSTTGLVFPIEAIARLCRDRGVLLLVDGAHGPGSVELDIAALGASWYVGNLHKWMWTARSSAVLWASPAQQAHLHPNVVSWELDQGFTAEFGNVGTRDSTPHLTAPTALKALQATGIEKRRSWCEGLVRRARALLVEHGAVATGPPEMVGMMASVLLPASCGPALPLRARLLEQHGIEVHLGTLQGRSCLRMAAEIYNHVEEYEALVEAIFAPQRIGGKA